MGFSRVSSTRNGLNGVMIVVYDPVAFPIGMRIKESIPKVNPRVKIVITKKLTAALFPAVRVTLMAIAAEAIANARQMATS